MKKRRNLNKALKIMNNMLLIYQILAPQMKACHLKTFNFNTNKFFFKYKQI